MSMIEFFYDIGSPWTYLAFHKIEALAARVDAELVWKPILVGGVFNAVNESVYAQRANSTARRAGYMKKDLGDWAGLYGLEIAWPPSVFPVNSVKAMRGALVAFDAGCGPAWSRACFEAYWGRDEDVSKDAVLREIAGRVGLEPDALLDRIGEPAIKERLRATTQELIDRGGFGSPTIFVNGDDMYFGNDRLTLVEAALAR
jgi:2-hydroxychromene-2-carboxylate isomerase